MNQPNNVILLKDATPADIAKAPTADLAKIKQFVASVRPKTLDQARSAFGDIGKMLEAVSASGSSADNLGSAKAAIAAVKQKIEATGRPRNFEAACEALNEIGKIATASLKSTPQVSGSTMPNAPTTKPAQAPKPGASDADLLAHYVQLEGDERRAFFSLHGGAIWRAHERAMRSRNPSHR